MQLAAAAAPVAAVGNITTLRQTQTLLSGCSVSMYLVQSDFRCCGQTSAIRSHNITVNDG